MFQKLKLPSFFYIIRNSVVQIFVLQIFIILEDYLSYGTKLGRGKVEERPSFQISIRLLKLGSFNCLLCHFSLKLKQF